MRALVIIITCLYASTGFAAPLLLGEPTKINEALQRMARSEGKLSGALAREGFSLERINMPGRYYLIRRKHKIIGHQTIGLISLKVHEKGKGKELQRVGDLQIVTTNKEGRRHVERFLQTFTPQLGLDRQLTKAQLASFKSLPRRLWERYLSSKAPSRALAAVFPAVIGIEIARVVPKIMEFNKLISQSPELASQFPDLLPTAVAASGLLTTAAVAIYAIPPVVKQIKTRYLRKAAQRMNNEAAASP